MQVIDLLDLNKGEQVVLGMTDNTKELGVASL